VQGTSARFFMQKFDKRGVVQNATPRDAQPTMLFFIHHGDRTEVLKDFTLRCTTTIGVLRDCDAVFLFTTEALRALSF
jgi:hypothetical protein